MRSISTFLCCTTYNFFCFSPRTSVPLTHLLEQYKYNTNRTQPNILIMKNLFFAIFASTILLSCNEEVINVNGKQDSETRAFVSTFSFDEVTKPEVWKSFKNVEEMKAACQIPDDILSKMSTEELAKVCINYPLYGNYALYNDYETGIKAVMSGFNGFTELQKRADAGEKIIDCLERYNPANVSSTRSRSADFPALRIDYINKLLELGGFTIQDSIRYKNIMLEKEYELAQIPVPISDSALDDSFDDEINVENFDLNNIQTIADENNDTTIQTCYGQIVQVKRPEEMAESKKQYLIEYIRRTYPGVTVLKQPSQKYNCHSYAWNLTEQGLVLCWIDATIASPNDNISKFWTNDYFGRSSGEATEKVFYYASDHSGVVSNDTSKCISKWGIGPLVRHDLGYGPYENMDKRYYYKGENCAHGTLENSEMGILMVGGTVSYGISKEPPLPPTKFPVREDWVVLDAKGNDVTHEEYITIDKTTYNRVRITFNRAGIYEIYYNIYHLSGNKLIQYNTETYVEL